MEDETKLEGVYITSHLHVCKLEYLVLEFEMSTVRGWNHKFVQFDYDDIGTVLVEINYPEVEQTMYTSNGIYKAPESRMLYISYNKKNFYISESELAKKLFAKLQ